MLSKKDNVSQKTSKTAITRNPTSRRKPRTPKIDFIGQDIGTSLTYVDTGRSVNKNNKSTSRNKVDFLREIVSPYPLLEDLDSPRKRKSQSPYFNNALNTSSS